ncbi:MAG: secretin N-terminal domain-containing protein [Candidatus Omnitrophota bacterium]
MIKIFRLGLIISLLTLGLPLPRLNAESVLAPPNDEPGISMDFKDAGLKDILKVFSIQSGLNFIASEALQDRKITLYLDRVPLKKSMEKLFKANNLSYELDKDSNIFIVKDWGKLTVDTVTKVFYLKHATVSSSSLMTEITNNLKDSSTDSGTSSASSVSSSASSVSSSATKPSSGSSVSVAGVDSGITSVVKKLLSSSGSVIEDFRTNSLIVTATPDRMAVVDNVIKSLDVPISQVMLEVEMLDVSKNSIDRMGIKWTDVMTSSMFEAALTGAKVGTGFPIPNFISSSFSKTKTFTSGTMDFSQLTWKVFFDYIRQQSDTKVLARPRILTLDNETAQINITTNEAVGSVTTTQGQGTASTTTTSAERIITGVSLRVTPQVNSDTSEITMFIMPIVRDATTSTFNTSFKDPEERSTKSVVRVKDGETVIIGGLIRKDRSEVITKMPILGDIPLIGAFFRHKYKDKDKERELLVFITPRIIKTTAVKLAQMQKAAPLEREQNTDSGASRELIISSSLSSFENKKK